MLACSQPCSKERGRSPIGGGQCMPCSSGTAALRCRVIAWAAPWHSAPRTCAHIGLEVHERLQRVVRVAADAQGGPQALRQEALQLRSLRLGGAPPVAVARCQHGAQQQLRETHAHAPGQPPAQPASSQQLSRILPYQQALHAWMKVSLLVQAIHVLLVA